MRQMLYCFMAVTLMVLTVPASAGQTVHGVLRVVKGKVQVRSARDGKTVRAKVGQKVFPQDAIITGPNSRAKVVMIDNNEINVSPDSEVKFEKYEYNPGENKKDVLLNVIYGKVRSKVEQKYDGKTTKFQVKTPSAVAGVRGTDFLTSYDTGSKTTNVVTFHGKVEFGTPGKPPVMIGVGQMASVQAGKAPTPPAAVPKTKLSSLDSESKADPGAGGNSPDARTPAAGDSDDSKSDEGDKAIEKEEPKAAPREEPKKAAEGEKASSDKIKVDKSDVLGAKPDERGPASAGPRGEIKPPPPPPPPPVVMPPPIPTQIVPDVVRDIITNTGPSRVNITIINK